MYITNIERGKGKKYRVYSEGNFIFALYGNELKKFGIDVNNNIEEEIINSIIDNIIYKRAKERAFYLLERKMYTVSMMRDKLKDSDYPDCVVGKVLALLINYNYLDDVGYLTMYIKDNEDRKSRRQLLLELGRRGIDKNLIDEYFYEHDYSEEKCFNRQFEKYIKGKDLTDFSVRQKVFRYFYGKGFASDLIKDYIQQFAKV